MKKSLYMSTFVFHGKADLQKKMPNSSSPPRAHSQQSLSKYSVFLIPWNPSANKPHQSQSISYHQGQKQEYPISCFFPVFSFVLVLPCKNKDKESNMSEPPLQSPVRNRLLGTFACLLPLHCSRVLILNCYQGHEFHWQLPHDS